MSFFCKYKYFLIASLFLFNFSFSSEVSDEDVWKNNEVVVRGNRWKALSIAFNDYKSEYIEKKQYKKNDYLMNMSNYNVELGESDSRYYVRIYLRYPIKLINNEFNPITYIIDKNNFEIIK